MGKRAKQLKTSKSAIFKKNSMFFFIQNPYKTNENSIFKKNIMFFLIKYFSFPGGASGRGMEME